MIREEIGSGMGVWRSALSAFPAFSNFAPSFETPAGFVGQAGVPTSYPE
jgi:hypothetical protein